VDHTEAFFGSRVYKDHKIDITATEGDDAEKQQLFATCKDSTTRCDDDTRTSTIGQLNEVIIS